MPVAGIDLAGKEKNDTGVCIYFLKELDEKPAVRTFIARTDEDILELVKNNMPKVIAIDAPLSFPKQEEGYFRKADRLLIDRGFRVLSPVFRGMRILVKRAINLKSKLEGIGCKVIETYPHAVQEIFGLEKPENKSQDEFDAFLCALAAKSFLVGEYEDLEGIIIPK